MNALEQTYAEFSKDIDPKDPLASAGKLAQWLGTSTGYASAHANSPYGTENRFAITLTPLPESPYDTVSIHFKPVRLAMDGLSALRVISQKTIVSNHLSGHMRNVRPAPYITSPIEPNWTANNLIDAVCDRICKKKTANRRHRA